MQMHLGGFLHKNEGLVQLHPPLGLTEGKYDCYNHDNELKL